MASYTDRTPQFNPYVEQLPVDAMVKVGMEKQQQYNQGIQKIQGQIDNVAGLDIAKDSHKQYLQSRLDNLGTQLKSVAAADFSNNQLVTSTAGMAASIAKDPIIQNAVYSTQVIRKGQQDLEAAKMKGKSSVQNEAFWNKQINDWNNDADLSTKFNGSYVPYTDINKKLREVADKIHEVDNSVDIPYQRDNSGNTIYYKTDLKTKQVTTSIDPNSGGIAKIDDAMLRIKTKGKPAEKILSNFMDSLDENDQQQLHIDSWYHYRGVSPEALVADITNNYQNAKKLAADKLINLNVELTTNSSLNASQKSALQARITALNTDITTGTIDKEYQSQIREIESGNAENYKYKIYTQKYLTNLAKDMSYESTQQEYMNNPYFQADMAKKDLQFKYDNAAREQGNWNRNFAWEHEKHDEDLKLGYAKLSADAEGKAGSKPVVVSDRISTDVSPISLVGLESDIKSISSDIDNLNAKYVDKLPGTQTLTTIKDKKDYLDKLASEAAKDPNFITKQNNAELKEYLKQRRAYEIMAAQKQSLYNEATKVAPELSARINTILANTPGITLDNGHSYKARDLFEVSQDIATFMKPDTSGSALMDPVIGGSSNVDVAGFMNKYKGTKNEDIAKVFLKNMQGQPLSSEEKKIIVGVAKIRDEYIKPLSGAYEEIQIAQSKFLNERMPERQILKGALSSKNKVDMDKVTNLIALTNDDYSRGGVDSRQKKDYSPDAIMALRNDPKKDVDYIIRKKYDGSAELTIQSGTTQYTLPMTAQRFNAFFPEYSRQNPISEIKYNILQSPTHSTNIKGVTDGSSAVNAGLQGSDLPQIAGTAIAPLVRMDVNGSAFNDGSGNDKYQIVLYVNDNGVWIPEILNSEYVNDGGLQAIINNIGTNTVDQILKKHKTQK